MFVFKAGLHNDAWSCVATGKKRMTECVDVSGWVASLF